MVMAMDKISCFPVCSLARLPARFPACALFALVLAGCHARPDADGHADATTPQAPAAQVRSGAGAQRPPEKADARLAAAAAAGFRPFVDPRGRITQGRCHMDACSWTKWLTLEVVGGNQDEVELQATVLGGLSEHARGDGELPDYPDSADGVAIAWDAEPVRVRYRCSKTRPRMQWGDEAPVALTLDPGDFVPGAMEGAVRGYFVACHGDATNDTADPAAAVAKYGYHSAAQGRPQTR